MLPKELTKDISNRLKSIKGQIEGIIKMFDEGAAPGQISTQFKSVDKGLQKAHHLLLDEVFRKALAIGIVKAAEECPGNCGYEDKIKYLMQQFPNFELTEIAERLKEIQVIEQRLKDLNGGDS